MELLKVTMPLKVRFDDSGRSAGIMLLKVGSAAEPVLGPARNVFSVCVPKMLSGATSFRRVPTVFAQTAISPITVVAGPTVPPPENGNS